MSRPDVCWDAKKKRPERGEYDLGGEEQERKRTVKAGVGRIVEN